MSAGLECSPSSGCSTIATHPFLFLWDGLLAAMEEEGLSKTDMAHRMQTSRSALNRLLDPENESVTLAPLQKAATAIARELRLELV